MSARRSLPEGGLRVMRPIAGLYMNRRWDVTTRGEFHVPETGPVIFASNHIGWLDGPMLILRTPRPAHALVKAEAFEGRTGWLLRFTGQIPLHRERPDTAALRTAAAALTAGQSVVIYPEGVRGAGDVEHVKDGVGWLALFSGAPVVPVALFGTRTAGADAESKPAQGAPIEIVYGEPLRIPRQDGPRSRARIAEAAQQIHRHLQQHVADAAEHAPVPLPGPLPELLPTDPEETADV